MADERLRNALRPTYDATCSGTLSTDPSHPFSHVNPSGAQPPLPSVRPSPPSLKWQTLRANTAVWNDNEEVRGDIAQPRRSVLGRQPGDERLAATVECEPKARRPHVTKENRRRRELRSVRGLLRTRHRTLTAVCALDVEAAVFRLSPAATVLAPLAIQGVAAGATSYDVVASPADEDVLGCRADEDVTEPRTLKRLDGMEHVATLPTSGSRSEVDCHASSVRAVEVRQIDPGPAHHIVVTPTGNKDVAGRAAAQLVGTCSSRELIVAGPARQPVPIRATGQDVVLGPPRTRSKPSPACSRSLPEPPHIKSFPDPAITLSLPPRAAITSSSAVPSSRSAPGVPKIVAGRP